jgi:hypothetical protein
MKTIQNLFFSIEEKNQFEAAKQLIESGLFDEFHPRMTINSSRRFLVLEFPEYTGHDKHKSKEALEKLFWFGVKFGVELNKSMNLTYLKAN